MILLDQDVAYILDSWGQNGYKYIKNIGDQYQESVDEGWYRAYNGARCFRKIQIESLIKFINLSQEVIQRYSIKPSAYILCINKLIENLFYSPGLYDFYRNHVPILTSQNFVNIPVLKQDRLHEYMNLAIQEYEGFKRGVTPKQFGGIFNTNTKPKNIKNKITKNKKQITKNKKQRTKNKKQRTKNKK